MSLNRIAVNSLPRIYRIARPSCFVLPLVLPGRGTIKNAAIVRSQRLYTTNTKTEPIMASPISTSNATTKHKTRDMERLEQMIKKSKILTKLHQNPKFNKYFERLREVGAIPTVTSFIILHELTAVIPLLLCWYIFYHLNLFDGFNITESSNPLLIKCNAAIERMVGDKYETLDKHNLIISGAISYSIVKFLGPIRMLVSLWAAPYFGRYLVLPFYKVGPLIKQMFRNHK